MKLFSATVLAMMALTGVHGQKALRQQEDAPKYAFLISNISESEDWCITAPEVDYDFASLRLQPCDFSGRPKNQLWSLDANGKLHSALDYNRCMVVDHGTDIFDGVRIKIARCNLNTSLNKFAHSGGSSKLTVLVNNVYCVTNRKNNPDANDTIHAKPCEEKSAHIFTYRA
jgi:hypothetical protein